MILAYTEIHIDSRVELARERDENSKQFRADRDFLGSRAFAHASTTDATARGGVDERCLQLAAESSNWVNETSSLLTHV